jgi:hypothetical protein
MYPLPEYKFSWTAEQAKLTVEIVLTPPASKPNVGWVGFGIAGTGGGMLGSDVFTAYPTGTNTCELQDRMATEKALPPLDTAKGGFSDWTVQSCSKVGSVFTVSASRPLMTFDEHDLDFVSGPMTLLFSWGQQAPTSPDTLTFHDGAYTPRTVSLWGEQYPVFNASELPTDADALTFVMPDVPIANGTSYTCVGFNLTQLNNTATHAVVFDPVVVENNIPYVHHMVVYVCAVPYNSTPFECLSMPANCKQILFAWGKGGGPMVLPSVTGIGIGMPGRQYVVLQMHYNNQLNVQGLTDASGLSIYRTNQLRQYDTGTFLFGTIGISVPSLKSAVTLSGICNNSASQAMLPAAGVTVYASFLHAHERGRRIWTSVVRNGKVIATIGNNQNYDFNLQKVQLLSPVLLEQGDEFITYCTYNTSVDVNDIIWGETTSNEMCFNFLYYYPIINPNISTQQCGTRGNPIGAGRPGPTSCSLQPGHPPAAYNVSGLTVADTNFYTGGSISCSNGFQGSAVLGCSGFGAPFTFSGCTRLATTPKADLSSASLHVVSFTAVLAVFLAV